ncbi:MBL fold metallo-hydrolase [Oscillatoria sp. FACHB-1406]|uniref:MBL fold metallo-hydrolase n=1 Tax=Oscillatoria sp. FACHB-1406 TaxID=2692846 RepID=UPI001688286C|nr:MBL fold metallo-hydrolase [Oscillatoria sp. FACHB-1406]MBD2576865.1 MBL fold metallo-hydrolase [Oscillatoria sp. FACHB-1406]
MKLLFLGSGSAFTVGADNFQSNMLLLDEKGNKLLLDCGSDIRFSLHAAGFSYRDITDIYISHLHADHVGGLEYIGFTTFFNERCTKPNLYASKDVVTDLWDRCLSGGMRDIGDDIADLTTYFDVKKISKNGYFIWQQYKFELVRAIHVHNSFYLMPSYGLFFEIEGLRVFVTTDTQLSLDENGECYESADLIFHDCETSTHRTAVHANYQDLRCLPARYKSKMWLYGYQPGHLPNAREDGFLGFVKRGQVFDLTLASLTSNYGCWAREGLKDMSPGGLRFCPEIRSNELKKTLEP